MHETNDRFLKYFDILIVTNFFFLHFTSFHLFIKYISMHTQTNVNIVHIIIDWISRNALSFSVTEIKIETDKRQKKYEN